MNTSPTAYLKDVAALARKPVQAFVGAESFLADRCVAALRAAMNTGAEPDLIRMDGEDCAVPADITEACRGLGLFGSHRLVIVTDRRPETRNFLFKNNDALTSYVEKPAKSATLVLIADSLRKNMRLSKTIESTGVRVDCETLNEADAAAWISGAAVEHGLDIDQKIARAMVDAHGPSLGILNGELQKMSSYLGATPDAKPVRVDQAAVDALAGPRYTGSTWACVDAMLQGRVGAALEIARALVNQGAPLAMLIGGFRGTFAKYLQARLMVDGGAKVNEAIKAARMFGDWAKLGSVIKNTNSATLFAMQERLLTADSDVKQVSATDEALLDCLVMDIARLARS